MERKRSNTTSWSCSWCDVWNVIEKASQGPSSSLSHWASNKFESVRDFLKKRKVLHSSGCQLLLGLLLKKREKGLSRVVLRRLYSNYHMLKNVNWQEDQEDQEEEASLSLLSFFLYYCLRDWQQQQHLMCVSSFYLVSMKKITLWEHNLFFQVLQPSHCDPSLLCSEAEWEKERGWMFFLLLFPTVQLKSLGSQRKPQIALCSVCAHNEFTHRREEEGSARK